MKKRMVIMAALTVSLAVGVAGCDQRQADDVSYNLSLEMDGN